MRKWELIKALEQYDDNANVVIEFSDYNPEYSEMETVQSAIKSVRCNYTGSKIILSED